MDLHLREKVVQQERRRLAVVKRIAIDPKHDVELQERAAMYAVALQSYINSIVLLTEMQAIFEDAMRWDSPPDMDVEIMAGEAN